MSKYKAYVICTSPRSGSTLLCNVLSETRVAGNPGSWFHKPSLTAWLDYYGLPQETSSSECYLLEKIVQKAIAKGTMDRGIFGLRMQSHSFRFFCEKLAILFPQADNDTKRIESAFGRTLFIHLTRKDKIEQAISYVKASQSGLWHIAPDGTEIERLSSPVEPTYDRGEIHRTVEELIAYDIAWDRWFQTEKPDRLNITYDLLAKDPIRTVGDILEKLELNTEAASGIRIGVAKLADEINRDWSVRYRSESRTV